MQLVSSAVIRRALEVQEKLFALSVGYHGVNCRLTLQPQSIEKLFGASHLLLIPQPLRIARGASRFKSQKHDHRHELEWGGVGEIVGIQVGPITFAARCVMRQCVARATISIRPIDYIGRPATSDLLVCAAHAEALEGRGRCKGLHISMR